MIYPVLGPIPNGAGTMVLRVVFLFLISLRRGNWEKKGKSGRRERGALEPTAHSSPTAEIEIKSLLAKSDLFVRLYDVSLSSFPSPLSNTTTIPPVSKKKKPENPFWRNFMGGDLTCFSKTFVVRGALGLLVLHYC